jgi:hypothetical protein
VAKATRKVEKEMSGATPPKRREGESKIIKEEEDERICISLPRRPSWQVT